MCGITGLVLGSRGRSNADYQKVKNDFTLMLLSAQSRGTDASGLFILNEGGRHFYYRAPVPASELVESDEYWNILSQVDDSTIAIVGHTRAATTGDPEVIENNHPIYDAPLVGVHNGVVHNHEQLRRKYGAVADVDSATIL